MIETPEWYNASVLVDRNLEAGRADKVAIYCGDEQVTYGELARRINRFGHALTGLGIDREDRVLLMLNDTPSFPTAFFAAMRIGAIPIPVNTLLKPADYRFFIENSRARAVVCDEMHHGTIQTALEDYDEEPVQVIVTNGRAEGAHVLEYLLESGEDELDPVATHKDDPAFWLYSSGSTGKPKGAVHLHHDIIYTCETYARHVLEVSEDDMCFSASKLFHAYGLGN
ncbi:MAG TPA: AMP-binding protein, partial [Rubrobacteraceae bacterium]|nr:AMP-binding protein [Rubrobacteraceae bacterium]